MSSSSPCALKVGSLTHFNGTDVIQGPITVVGTGNTPFDLVTANETYRNIFYDVPLDRLADENDDTMPGETPSPKYNRHNSDYASVSFKKGFGHSFSKEHMKMMTEEQIQLVRDHVQAAESRGLRARYWDTPGDGYLKWTIRGHVCDVLEREGGGGVEC